VTSVAICIPTLERRLDMLHRAVESVAGQYATHCDVHAVVELDRHREGAWATRNKAMHRALAAGVDWVGFLDDDDQLLAHHVDHLLNVARREEAAMVWGWFQIVYGEGRVQPEGVGDPFHHIVGPDGTTGYRGRQYDPALPHIVPITYLVRADVLAAAVELCGGFQPDTIGSWDLQDQPLIDAIYEVSEGALYADPMTTWYWHHHGANTSGMPDR
jgi:glycosyltransferase involved in cell wall biosynthesis